MGGARPGVGGEEEGDERNQGGLGPGPGVVVARLHRHARHPQPQSTYLSPPPNGPVVHLNPPFGVEGGWPGEATHCDTSRTGRTGRL